MAKRSEVPMDLWDWALTFLPADLDDLALEAKALTRRRGFGSAAQMLRCFLLYASVNSFRVAAELANASGLVGVTPEAIFHRLKNAEAFLEAVLARLVDVADVPRGFKLVLVDGTSLSGPASEGTDWRVHVGYDPVRGLPCSVKLTPASQGEALSLHELGPGELAVADMGYGTARNVHEVLSRGADALIRVYPPNLRMLHPDGTPVDRGALPERLPKVGPVSIPVLVPVPPEGKTSWTLKQAVARHPMRLVGIRTKDGEAVWLLTNVCEERLSDERACDLYRVRWQVELFFKRLKSLGDLDVLTSKDGPTARAALLAKLILLVLTNLLADEGRAFSPYGYRIRNGAAA
ncbi:MAG: IS4 family transposase [Fimbriimonas sp.]